MKRVAVIAHLPTHWLFKPAKRPDDRADYCRTPISSPSASTRYSFLHLSGVGRTMVSEPGELAVSISFLA